MKSIVVKMAMKCLTVAVFLIMIRNIEAFCTNTCSGSTTVPSGDFDLNFPCPSSNYQNNLRCTYEVSSGGNIIQALLKAVKLEPWHDFLKMDGPEYFLLFINATTGQLIITGYPASDLTIFFYTDSNTAYSGFNTTISSLSEDVLLEQYQAYEIEGAVQVLRSPLYISSSGSSADLDVMFINLPNDTNTLAEAWNDYAEIVLGSVEINIYDITDTGFSSNWTEVDASSYYDVIITDMSGSVLNRNRTTQNEYSYDGLPSGTELNVTVIAVNKLGVSRTANGNFTTGFAKPLNFHAYGTIGQTYISLKWDMVNGAIGYSIKWAVGEKNHTKQYTSTTAAINGLLPGVNYTMELRAVYETGVSAPVFLQQITVPTSLTNLSIVNITTTSFIPLWDILPGSEYVEFVVTNDTHSVTSVVLQNNEMGKRISGLDPATTYHVNARTGNEAGKSPPFETNFTTKLIPDSADLIVEDVTATGFTVKWSPIVGAIHYEISVSATNGLSNKTKKLNLETQSIFTNLPSGSNFDIILYVFDTQTSNKVLKTQASTDMAPPSDVAVYSVTQTSFRVKWTSISGAVSYYTDVTSSDVSLTIPDTSWPLLVNGLDYGTVYDLKVAAVFQVGTVWSNTISQITAPGNVTNLAVKDIGTKTFTPTWDSARGATSYEQTIVRVRDGSVVKKISSSTSGKQIYNLYPGTKHEARVMAVNTGGKSAETSEEFTTALSSPTDVKIVSVAKNQFLFTWKEVEEAISYYYTCSNKRPEVITETSVLVTGLQSNVKYTCFVHAVSEDGVVSGKVSAAATTSQRECEKDPCLNGGSCTELAKGFECKCAPGFEGTTCEKDIDWCKTKKCADNADCRNERLNAVCDCKKGFLGDGELRCRAYCKQASVMFQDVTLTFNSTYSGETAYSNENCDGGRSKASGVCSSRTENNGETISKFTTSDIILVKCELKVADVTIKVNETTDNVTAKELETQSAQLQVLTSAAEKLTNDEVEKVAEYIKDVGKLAEKNKESVTKDVLTGIVNTADNLISSDSIALDGPEPHPVTSSPGVSHSTTESPKEVEKREKEIKKKILKSLTTIAEQVKIPNNTKEIVIETKSMIVKVFEAPVVQIPEDPDEPAPPPPTSAWFAPVITESTDSESPDDATPSSEMRQPMNISIPFTALEEAEQVNGKKESKKKIRLTFFLHKDDSLFPSNSSPEMIIAASLGSNLSLVNLPDPIKIAYNDLSAEQGITKINSSQFRDQLTEFKCVYWDFDSGSWKTDGCCLSMDESGQATCQCDHLTNYALLVSKSDIPADVVIEIISDIGCYLSIVGLLCTIIVHCMKEEIRKKTPTQLLLQICGCLLVSYLVFVIGISMTENERSCIAIAAILQYFLLASWCWMVVYASDMYRSFVLVFNASNSRYMTKCALFAYGVPLLITILNVAITVAHIDNNVVQPQTICQDEGGYNHAVDSLPAKSSYVADNMCWLHENSLYFGFLLPVGLMLVFNIFVYAMVMKTLVQRGNNLQSSAKRASAKANLLISITISASTGMTWIVGYLMLLSDDENYLLVTSWIFSLLNACQGFVIFLTTCVRHENMRKIWWAPIRQCLSRGVGRIQLLSPRRQAFDLKSTSETTSSATGSKSTQNTKTSKSTSAVSFTAKDYASEMASETAF